MPDCLVIRARTLVSMAGEAPARGEQLFAPLRKLDDAALVLADGRVEEVVSWKRCSPPSGKIRTITPQPSCSDYSPSGIGISSGIWKKLTGNRRKKP